MEGIQATLLKKTSARNCLWLCGDVLAVHQWTVLLIAKIRKKVQFVLNHIRLFYGFTKSKH